MIDTQEITSLAVLMRKFKELAEEHNRLIVDVAEVQERINRKPGRPKNAGQAESTSSD